MITVDDASDDDELIIYNLRIIHNNKPSIFLLVSQQYYS
jgi:hypothetical protein